MLIPTPKSNKVQVLTNRSSISVTMNTINIEGRFQYVIELQTVRGESDTLLNLHFMEDKDLIVVEGHTHLNSTTFQFADKTNDRFAELVIFLSAVMSYYDNSYLLDRLPTLDFANFDYNSFETCLKDLVRSFESNSFVNSVELAYYHDHQTVRGLFIYLA
jgi:hypothetical protein